MAAGTLTLEHMQRIQIYLVTYVAMSMIVALLDHARADRRIDPSSRRDLFGRLRDSLIVAFVAGDLFIVLPGLIEGCKDCWRATAWSRRSRRGPGHITAGPT